MKSVSQKRSSSRKIFLVRLRKPYREDQSSPIGEEEAWRHTPSLAIAFSKREEAERYTELYYPQDYEPFWSGVFFTVSGDALEFYDRQGEWIFRLTFAEWDQWLREITGVIPPAPATVPDSLSDAEAFWRHWLETTVRETGPAKWRELWRRLDREPFEIIEVDFEER